MSKYIPVLTKLESTREQWEDQAPRLTEEQKREVQEITRSAFSRFSITPITRKNFLWIHEHLENELAEKMLEKFGLVCGVEWRCNFPTHVVQAMSQAGIPTRGFVEGVLPTHDFTESEIFDYIEMFQPTVVLFQFDDYDKFMSSAEESIRDSEARRKAGDAYFTERDRQINYRPPLDNDATDTEGSTDGEGRE
jgi:hypothetical protein